MKWGSTEFEWVGGWVSTTVPPADNGHVFNFEMTQLWN